ncbi:septum formation family protein [Pseudarthrobacter sp. NamE5]|uniref:septum formation family protein n=1 Tax=Pseudarthrobacter sp. NamE5 TaxID=2576839 RepID=UPI00110B8B25|nr:septum formation family protein [Pseudarthrobacter sp. NamE5]TLM83102.1 hypothetical protein FDW84_14900 [Pseudarthrobacter sp. NamE5]
MNDQDVPPKPAAPPTSGLPRVPAPAAQPVLHPQMQPQDEAPSRPSRLNRRALWIAVFVAVLLAVIGALVWLALWLNSNPGADDSGSETSGVLETTATTPATPLPLPREGVQPPDYALGDCFKDFDPEALASTVVPCDTGHSAQLVALYRYPEDAAYPGADALKAKALEACQAARLGPAANLVQLNYQRSFPSSTSWESGDRRVDCYVTAPGGNVINASVLP